MENRKRAMGGLWSLVLSVGAVALLAGCGLVKDAIDKEKDETRDETTGIRIHNHPQVTGGGVNTHDLVSITLTQGAGTPTVHSVSVAPGDVAEFLGIASGQWTVSNVVFDDSHVGTLIDSNGNASTGVVIVSDFQFDDLWALY